MRDVLSDVKAHWFSLWELYWEPKAEKDEPPPSDRSDK